MLNSVIDCCHYLYVCMHVFLVYTQIEEVANQLLIFAQLDIYKAGRQSRQTLTHVLSHCLS